MEMRELVARERVRDTVARYNWSGDAGRIEDLTQCFCAEGELEVRGVTIARGRDAIAAFLGGVKQPAAQANAVKRIVRHNVANIRFTEVAPEQVSVSSYFTVFTEIGLDHYGRYRDVFVPVSDEWLIRHRFVSTDWRSPDSTMAPPSSVS